MHDNGNRTKDWVSNINNIRLLFSNPEVKTKYDLYNHPSYEQYSFKEGIERINAETDRLLENSGYRHIREKGYYDPIMANEHRIAIFTHAGFDQAFMSSMLDIPYPQITTQFSMGHSGVTVICIQVTDISSEMAYLPHITERIAEYNNKNHQTNNKQKEPPLTDKFFLFFDVQLQYSKTYLKTSIHIALSLSND